MTLQVISTFPTSGEVGIPLLSDLSITLAGTDFTSSSLEEGFFVEGPDTDQFVGPGMLGQIAPGNISQGELDDFLASPDYQGIVAGDVVVTGIEGNTKVIFSPTYPYSPLTEYSINLTGIQDAAGDDVEGFIIFPFTAGSGSITELPSTSSVTVLNSAVTDAGADSDDDLEVISTSPVDHSVENSTDLAEIEIEFNKDIDSDSLSGNITVETVPATDHPNASTQEARTLATVISASGNKITVRI